MKLKKILLCFLILVTIFSVFAISSSAANFPLGSQSNSAYLLREGYYSFDLNSSRPLDFSYFDFNSNYEYYFNFPFYLNLTIENVGSAVLFSESMQVYYSSSSDDGYEINVRLDAISSINALDASSYNLIESYINSRIGDYENMYRSIQGFTNYITALGTFGTTAQIYLPNAVYAPSNFYYFISNCSFYNQRPYDFLVPESYEFLIPDTLSQSYAFGFEFTCDGVGVFDTIFIESENNIVKTVTYSNSVSGVSIPVYRGGFENPDKKFQMRQYQYIKPIYSYALINNDTFGYIQILSQFITYKPYYVNPGYDIYNDGYIDGYGSGYDYGYYIGEAEGIDEGYDIGYDDGKEDGLQESVTSGFFTGIVDALDSLKIGPISVYDIIITIFGLFIFGWILKLIAGG